MDEQKPLYKIVLRHDLSTNWVINNPVLLLGEYGVEDDTHRMKRGDGVSTWSQLLYETFGIEDIITPTVQQSVLDNVTSYVTETLNTFKTTYIDSLTRQVQQNTQDIEELKREDINNNSEENNNEPTF